MGVSSLSQREYTPSTGCSTEGGTVKVLLAYDGFEHSLHALEEAAELASGGKAEVTVMSVVPPDARGSKAGGHVGLRPHAHEDVARAHEFLLERGVEAEMTTAHGDPAEEILAEAGKGGYDLIVVGSRKRGVIARALLGSVSEELAGHAPCPVLIADKDGQERIEPASAATP
jgi:nucleotide-binding universal stress UspA family protein